MSPDRGRVNHIHHRDVISISFSSCCRCAVPPTRITPPHHHPHQPSCYRCPCLMCYPFGSGDCINKACVWVRLSETDTHRSYQRRAPAADGEAIRESRRALKSATASPPCPCGAIKIQSPGKTLPPESWAMPRASDQWFPVSSETHSGKLVSQSHLIGSLLWSSRNGQKWDGRMLNQPQVAWLIVGTCSRWFLWSRINRWVADESKLK